MNDIDCDAAAEAAYREFADEQLAEQIDRLTAEIEALLEVIAPFAYFALVRSALGNTAPKSGTVYSVCTTLGEAEISAEDFEAAFNAIARNKGAE